MPLINNINLLDTSIFELVDILKDFIVLLGGEISVDDEDVEDEAEEDGCGCTEGFGTYVIFEYFEL